MFNDANWTQFSNMNARFRQKRLATQRGATVVEFALVATIYLYFVFCVIDLAYVFFINLTMQHAVRQGARYAVTGQSDLDPAQANQQRYRAIIAEMERSSMGYFDSAVDNIVITINGGPATSYGKSATYVPGMFGGPGDIVVFRLDCKWPTIMPIWRTDLSGDLYVFSYVFSVATAMRNEAY
jgi:hypothetical protein